TTVGVTYDPSIPNLPPPERVASTIASLGIPAVRLVNPSPRAVRAFARSDVSLLISVPNRLVPVFAVRRAAAVLWVRRHILPYHPRTRISLISIGSESISAAYPDPTLDPSAALLPAVRTIRLALHRFSIRTIPVSAALSFVNAVRNPFPPSSAEFQEPIGALLIRPLLQFLEETDSPFLINIYPIDVYRIRPEIPLGFALFQEGRLNYRDDPITGIRYRNLFDMMVDAVSAAMSAYGKQNISIIVAETGWPTNGGAGKHSQVYVKGLVEHLRSWRTQRVTEAYIYQLFDENDNDTARITKKNSGQTWGIMHPDMKMKFDIEISGSRNLRRNGIFLPLLLASMFSLQWLRSAMNLYHYSDCV
ncbi:glycosyl hydrolases family 17 protein, partial [Genlisea aurea]